jgi:hypothetical protein
MFELSFHDMKLAFKGFGVQRFADLLLVFVAMFVCASTAAAQVAGTFTATGTMTTAQTGHTATLLSDGTVRIVGGHTYIPRSILGPFGIIAPQSLDTTEPFDPSTGIFTTTANMITSRGDHSATLLADGKVLIAGGNDSHGGAIASAEIYDPSTLVFRATGSMSIPRAGHTATLLNSGKVLIAGGYASSPLASAEIYDPATGVFTTTGDMTVARATPKAILLPNGKVLLAPGDERAGYDTAELFDPDRRTFKRITAAISSQFRQS